MYDHTSILRFLEWRFLGAPAHGNRPRGSEDWWLTKRDRNANNIGQVLGLETPDPELGFDIDLDLPTFSPECTEPAAAPGTGIGGPGESPISKKLQKLTAEKFPDTSAQPWIEGPERDRPHHLTVLGTLDRT